MNVLCNIKDLQTVSWMVENNNYTLLHGTTKLLLKTIEVVYLVHKFKGKIVKFLLQYTMLTWL